MERFPSSLAPGKSLDHKDVYDRKGCDPDRSTCFRLQDVGKGEVACSTQCQQSPGDDFRDATESSESLPLNRNKTRERWDRQNSRLSSRQNIFRDLELIKLSTCIESTAGEFGPRRSFHQAGTSGTSSIRQEECSNLPTFIPRNLEVLLQRRMSSKLNVTCRYIDIMIQQTVSDDRFVLAIVKDPEDVSDINNNDYLLRVKLTINCVPNPANNYISGYLAEVKARGRLYQFQSKHNEFKVRGVASQCFLIRTTS